MIGDTFSYAEDFLRRKAVMGMNDIDPKNICKYGAHRANVLWFFFLTSQGRTGTT